MAGQWPGGRFFCCASGGAKIQGRSAALRIASVLDEALLLHMVPDAFGAGCRSNFHRDAVPCTTG